MKRTESERTVVRTVDWYAQGDAQVVEIDGKQIVVLLVGRKGRRARISIVAPETATFATPEDQQQSVKSKVVTNT